MERWAFRVKVRAPDRELYGFDIDESSNGMAAFPGLFHTEARKRALLEAVERASVIAWWEGVLDGEVRSTDWPGISALGAGRRGSQHRLAGHKRPRPAESDR